MESHQLNFEEHPDIIRDVDGGDSMSDIYDSDGHDEDLLRRLRGVGQSHEGQSKVQDGSERKRKVALSLPLEGSQSFKRTRLDGLDDEKASDSLGQSRQNMACRLPVELWHHVFVFVPPRTLGSLMLVNRQFNIYLDPSSAFKSASTYESSASTVSIVSKLRPDAIWQASRRLFWPRMPAAMKGRSELEMWRLCCSRACQFCKLRGNSHGNNSEKQWKKGPGAKGVEPVFPFFIVSCGRCLGEKSVKEIDLLLNSSMPSVLVPGLPMLFLAQENHVVPPHLLSSGNPSQGQPVKVFWGEQIKNIKDAFEDAKAFGPAAAEEWIKGLESQGNQFLVDVARWERWWLAGGVEEVRKSVPKARPPTVTNGQSVTTGCLPSSGDLYEVTSQLTEAGSFNTAPLAHGGQREGLSMNLDPPVSGLRKPSDQPRSGIRSAGDVAVHNSQVKTPKNEAAKTEGEKQADTTVAINSSLNSGRVTDADWDEAQGPLRAQISAFADEAIGTGRKQTHKPKRRVKGKARRQFAVNVLLHVRKRFYAKIAKDTKAAAALGKKLDIEPPQGPWTRKLTLENMTWIFDVKIKPCISDGSDHIFLCNGCKGAPKYYGLRDLVQHYAAKHTTTLSSGNTVVHWRAEWPETPVFKSKAQSSDQGQPKRKKTALHSNSSQRAGASNTPGLIPSPTVRPVPNHDMRVPTLGMSAAPANYGPGAQSAIGSWKPYLPSGHMIAQSHDWYSNALQLEPALSHDGSFLGRSHYVNEVSQNAGHGQDSGAVDKQASTRAAAHEALFRLDCMVEIARQVWQKVASVKGVDDSVRVCAVIHHIAKTFQTKYAEPAPLGLFIEAVNTRKAICQLLSVTGLVCKACKLGVYATSETKTYSLGKLLKHFKSKHSDSALPPLDKPLDWRVDMIWLPGISTLMELRDVIGDNKGALDVISDTLPWVFEQPRRDPSHRYDGAPSRGVNTEWQHQTNTSRETFTRSENPPTAARLELDGFEIIERPSTLPNRQQHTPRHGVFDVPPPATSQRTTYYSRDGSQHEYSELPPTNHSMTSSYDSHWRDTHHDNHRYAPADAPAAVQYPAQPSHERRPAVPYETVEVRDARGDYLIRRPMQHAPSRDMYYEKRDQPLHPLSYGRQQPYNHDINGRGSSQTHTMSNDPRISDYEEYDPRFPGGVETTSTRETMNHSHCG